jgi:hypothetical protein
MANYFVDGRNDVAAYQVERPGDRVTSTRWAQADAVWPDAALRCVTMRRHMNAG